MLALVVFLNGMAVMVLEMAGARMLAPELGTSIIVWTSLIGVILASLSAGYWLGGRLADKKLQTTPSGREQKSRRGAALPPDPMPDAARATLSHLLVAAAISVFLVALFGATLAQAVAKRFSLYAGTVCVALALFALPGLLCGMVSPYAIRLGITSSATSGAIIGRMNAMGTIGSIVGTFLGGFVLLSWFSTSTIFFGVSACLLAAAALVRLRPVLPKIMLALLVFGALCLDIAVIGGNAERDFHENNAPLSLETPYSSIRIAKGALEGRNAILLQTDPGSWQSGMFADDPAELLFPYTRQYALGTAMNPDAERILMLGGGGYSIPKWLLAGRSDLARKDFSLDVVELDPGMTRAAGRYFQAPLDDPRLRVYHEDARVFLNRAAETVPAGEYGPYDLIFADIFNSWYTVPFHVGTREAAGKIRALLARDGMYIMNIITAVSGDNGRLLRSIRAAFTEVFGKVELFAVHSRDAGVVQNVMLVAFRTARSLPDPVKEKVPQHIAKILAARWTAAFPDPEEDVPPLSDAFAPVERYTLGFTRRR
jgi:spermidine synthase